MNAASRLRFVVALAAASFALFRASGAEPARRFASEIAAFKAADATNAPSPGGVVFIGSSSVVRWKSLQHDFPGLNVINRGFGGSQISDVLLYPDDIVLPYKPKAVVFYCGGNDIHAGKTPERVFSDFQSFAETVHRTLPRTKIYFISIAPNPARFAEMEKDRRANRMVEEYCRDQRHQTEFIDIFPRMLGPDGVPQPELYVSDRLHMTPAGYAVWVPLVRKAVFGEP